MAKKKEKPADEPADILGGLSLGGIFKGLGDFVDLLGKLAEKGEALKKEGQFTVPTAQGKPLRGVYGFSVRTMGGRPVVESFGNVKSTPQGPQVQEVREPLVDVFDEKDEVVVLAELPGIEEKAVRWEVHGDIVKLNADGALRKYAKEILLPCQVSSDPPRASFKNGILEMRFRKKS